MTLEFDGLRCRFGSVVALDGLSFTVPAGEVFGFLGPNGSGKTTAMRALFGLVRLEAGEVRWHGRGIDRAAWRRFGYMPEERGLYPGMLVGEQLQYLAQLHGRSAPDALASARHWLERLGVADREQSRVETLSLGNQQRVQLAAALVHEPDALILDEPLSGLDPVGIDAVSQVLVEQAHEGRCVLFSSHQLDLVEDLCESVAIIDRGRLVASGHVDDLASAGRRRLVVKVEGDAAGRWAAAMAGVQVSRVDAGLVRLVLDEDVDPQSVLRTAMQAGPVLQFGFERRRLSEVFREAVHAA
ncbi:MAG TPA: ATP-binding cassette domain-containing protein [Jatrophihabitantaceae bacterium]|nr:ATP-binding cassette domain-containing protein [Jatrophihabitantaceae bacterium]